MRHNGRGCCPMHFLFGFAPNRAHCHVGEDLSAGSFLSQLPIEPSDHCTTDKSATSDLYQILAPDRLLVFRDVNVIPMRGVEKLVHRDVAIRAGIIESVGPTGADWPSDAVIIEGRGKTLIPGLADLHTHPMTAARSPVWQGLLDPAQSPAGSYLLPYDLMLFQLLACGITRIEVLAGDADTLWLRDRIEDGTLIGPRMSVGSPQIDGNPPLAFPQVCWIATDRAGGEQAAARIKELGFDFAKVYTRLSRDAFEGLITGCERHGIRLMGHVPSEVGVEDAIRLGQRGIAHAGELFYNELDDVRDDVKRIERIAKLMADEGAWLQSTVSAMHRLEARFAPDGAPDTLWMNPLMRAIWDPASPMMAMALAEENSRYYDRTYQLTKRAQRIAHQAGVKTVSGTDFPAPYLVEGFSLHEELMRLSRDCGFSNLDALASSTINAAEYLGEGEIEGTITEGAKAHLVLLRGDPLEDINETREIDSVLIGKAYLTLDAISKGLQRVQAHFTAMPEPKFIQF